MRTVVLLRLALMFGMAIAQTQTQSIPNSPTSTATPSNEASAERIYSRKDGKIKPPRVTYSPDPEYPREASQRFKDEKVVLFIVVGSDGVPRDIKVARPLAPNVDQPAIEAVKKWKFRPATLDGKAVAVRINIELPVKP